MVRAAESPSPPRSGAPLRPSASGASSASKRATAMRSSTFVRRCYLLALATMSAGIARLAHLFRQRDIGTGLPSLLREDLVVALDLLKSAPASNQDAPSSFLGDRRNVTAPSSSQRRDHTSLRRNVTPFSSHHRPRAALPPELAASLPSWISDYLRWHDDQVRNLTASNWNKDGRRYLVFRCLRDLDPKCGGASDRIQPVPFGLMLANQTRRILFIDWTRPCRLEEFLVPPTGGLNWTVPSFVRFDYRPYPAIPGNSHARKAYELDRMMVDIRHQSSDHGQSYYDANRDDRQNEPNFLEVYSRVWRIFFEPSQPVADLLERTRQRLGLEPGHYVSLHVRSQYAADATDNLGMVENAVNCAVSVRKSPADKIYLASDSVQVIRRALEYADSHPGMVHAGAKVVVNSAVALLEDPPSGSNVSHLPQPLHLDRGVDFLHLRNADWMEHPPADFYDTFVDLYLLSGGSCTAFNIGGYGRWSSQLSTNARCRINHHRRKCPPPPGPISGNSSMSDGTAAAATSNPSAATTSRLEPASKVSTAVSSQFNLWDSSAVLPQWMKDYFGWHRDQLARLSPRNWDEASHFRYLVMRCLEVDGRCGGTSDRIQSVPYAILLANATRRILLITWERPHPLEEYLVPPTGGMNWTVPGWLLPLMNLSSTPESRIIRGSRTSHFAKRGALVVQMRHQSHDHGAGYYDSSQPPDAPSFEQVFRDAWSVAFEPSPAVAAAIDRARRRLGLGNGGGLYASAHVRANYQRQDSNVDEQVRNAIDCASSLLPGATIYLATDSRNATLSGLRYGKSVGGTVVARIHPEFEGGDPLHLDRGSNFLSASGTDLEGRPPSDFYDTFVDLYLLAGGQCTAVGVGGYGRWANAISPSSSCVVDHTRTKCNWTAASASAVKMEI